MRACAPPARAITRGGATSLPVDTALEPGDVLARLVTSFATTETEVDRFVEIADG